MNFLGHLYLAGEDENLIIGNMIADAIRGKQIEKFSPDIIYGIKMHRSIDRFTDSNEYFLTSVKRLQPYFRKYTPVVIDIIYDHYLSLEWSYYSKTSLNVFVANAYAVLLKNYHILPQKVRNFIPFMIKNNWLVNYQHFDYMEKIFLGMSKRAKYESGMEDANKYIKKHYFELKSDFEYFLPEIKQIITELYFNHQNRRISDV